MYWNHRVLEKTYPDGEKEYGIIEVYYDDSGEVRFWTEEYMEVLAESVEGIKDTLSWMQQALSKPILIESKDDEGNPTLIEKGPLV